jgi:dCTP deaminase
MNILKKELQELLKNQRLIIKPLLSNDQIGELTIDFRLGYNFLVTIQGKNPFLDASLNSNDQFPTQSLFQETRRMLGETFLLHPHQTILTNSLEYIKLPDDIYAELSMRSSYLRLGISLSALVQPGYTGCMSLELTNFNKVPINLTVGAPIFQARLYKLDESLNYFSKKRKYMCQVRPVVSSVADDSDLKVLNAIWRQANYIDTKSP